MSTTPRSVTWSLRFAATSYIFLVLAFLLIAGTIEVMAYDLYEVLVLALTSLSGLLNVAAVGFGVAGTAVLYRQSRGAVVPMGAAAAGLLGMAGTSMLFLFGATWPLAQGP